MAALPTPDPRPDAGGQASSDRFRLLRELGAQALPAWAALESLAAQDTRLVVVERAARSAYDDGEIADWIRDARRLSALDHPNVARVRDVIIRGADILVVSDFVDGVRWQEFALTAPLETALRVFVDALTGLSALHNLRDAGDPKRRVFKLAHGGLIPDCIVVGLDGVARIVGASRPRSATARIAFTRGAYLAPEVLLEDDSADARADVYSVGVMLWEALSQRRFLPNLQPSAIVTQLLSGRVPTVTIPDAAPWAAPLGDVVRRALSADPEKRFPSAMAMAAELRRIGALKLPLTVRVAAGVRAACGDAVKARREELERGEVRASEAHLRSSRPPSDELAVDLTDDLTEALREPSQTASTVPPPRLPEPDPSPDDLRSVAAAVAALPAAVVVVAPPRPPTVLAPPQPPTVLAPPQPPTVLAPPQPPLAPVAPHRAIPPAPSVADASAGSTAAPFELATAARPKAPDPGETRSKRTVGIAAAGAALVAIGVAAWWVASRDAHPAAVLVAPSAIARPAAVPARESTAESPVPPATLSPSHEADLPPTNANASAAPNTPPRALTRPPTPAPASAVPLKPKRTPARRGYDPQGI